MTAQFSLSTVFLQYLVSTKTKTVPPTIRLFIREELLFKVIVL